MTNHSNDSSNRIAQSLVDAGVPRHVANFAAELRPKRWMYVGLAWMSIAIMVAGFGVGQILLWPALEWTTDANAREHARAVGGILYATNFGYSLLIGLFAWIFASGVIIGHLAALSKQLLASSFVYSLLERRFSKSADWMVRRSLAGASGESDPETYMRKVSFGWVTMFAIFALVLGLASTAAISRDIHTHSIYT